MLHEAVFQAGGGLPEITSGQRWTGIAVVIGMALALLYVWYRTRYTGLGPSNADRKDQLWSQLFHADPATLRIPAGVDAASYRDRLESLASADDAVDARDATVAGALADVRASAARTYAPILERIPDSAVRTVELAALVVLLGAPAVSTAAVIDLLQSDTGGWSPAALASGLADATATVATLGLEVLTAFPYAGTLVALGLTVALVGGEWLYRHWYVTTLVLVGGAAAVVVLEYYRERAFDDPLYGDRRSLARVVGVRVAVVWVAGVGPAAVGGAAGAGDLGAVVGVLAALSAATYYLAVATVGFTSRIADAAAVTWNSVRSGGSPESIPPRWPGDSDGVDPAVRDGIGVGLEYDPYEAAHALADRLDETGHDWRGPSADWGLAGVLLARRAIVASWLVVVPVVGAYALTGVTTGAYADVARAAVGASPAIQAVVLACVLAPLVAVAYLGRASLDDFVTGLRETWSRRRVRLAAFQRGVPLIVVVAVTAIAYSLTEHLWLAVGVGVAVGVLARVIYELLMAAKYRVSLFEFADDLERSVLVEAYTLALEDDGRQRTLYLGVLNGSTRVLAETPSAFADAVVDVHPGVATRDGPTPTEAMWRAEFALNYGIVDREETREKLHEQVRKRIMPELRDDQWAYRSDLESAVAEYPPSNLEWWLRRGRRHGMFAVEEDASGDDIVLLKRDPWRQRRGGSS